MVRVIEFLIVILSSLFATSATAATTKVCWLQEMHAQYPNSGWYYVPTEMEQNSSLLEPADYEKLVGNGHLFSWDRNERLVPPELLVRMVWSRGAYVEIPVPDHPYASPQVAKAKYGVIAFANTGGRYSMSWRCAVDVDAGERVLVIFRPSPAEEAGYRPLFLKITAVAYWVAEEWVLPEHQGDFKQWVSLSGGNFRTPLD